MALGFAVSRSPHGAVVRSETFGHEAEFEHLADRLEFICTQQPGCSGPVGVEPSTIASFQAAQGRVEHVPDSVPSGMAVVSSPEFDRRQEESVRRSVDRGSPSLIFLSPVGFSSDRHQALVYLTELCGGLCGGGWYLVFEQRNGDWVLTHALLDWIS